MVRIRLGRGKFLLRHMNFGAKNGGAGPDQSRKSEGHNLAGGVLTKNSKKRGPKKVTGRVGEEPGQSGERRKWYMNFLKGGMWVPYYGFIYAF
jgi:hypothetical protein